METYTDNEINCQQFNQNDDHQPLQKSDEHFSIIKVLLNEDKQVCGYNCIYRYQNHFIKLEYYLSDGIWKILPQQDNKQEEEKLNILLDYINNLPFEQQVQIIIKRFDQYFMETNEETPICSITEEDHHGKNISTLSTIKEDENHPNSSLVVSNRIRHSSSGSTASSVRFASFLPPSMGSLSRKRLIQSMLLHVQRKKKSLEKIVDTLTGKSSESSMYQLGLQFLRTYDGKFDYQQGHTFVMLFDNKNWLLTIDYIEYVEYQIEQKSILILNYKNKFTFVKL